MADTATSIPLPPPESNAMQPPAPGTVPGVEGNLASSTAQLPPAPPALAIPPNTNPIPTAITSPQAIPTAANGSDGMTPVTAGAAASVGRRPQVKSGNRTLYVGGLPGNCTEDQLTKIFGSLNKGSVVSVKLIPDKNVHSKGLYYGFVEFDDPAAAEHAMLIMNGRKIYEREIRINWAYQTNTTHKEDTSSHFHIFVGDLSNEVTDEALLQAFQTFGDVSEARVMWDMKTGRTRGYGFVAYRSQEGAVRAISEMDGEWLGSRQIRVNWANQKGQPSMAQSQAMAHAGVMPAGMPTYGQTMIDPTKQQANFTTVYNGAPMNVVTVYVGNLTPFTTNQDLHPLFSNFGNIVEIRYQQDRGYAFIKYGTHDEAATAILNLNGYVLNGRPLKCSWGRDRQSDRNPSGGPHSGGAPPSAGPHPGYGYDSAFPQSAPNSAYPHTPAGPYPPYGVNYPGNPMSPQGHTPGGPHYAPPPGAAQAPYTPMSGGPANTGAYGGHAGDARGSQPWAPQPGTYPPQAAQPPYGGYHG